MSFTSVVGVTEVTGGAVGSSQPGSSLGSLVLIRSNVLHTTITDPNRASGHIKVSELFINLSVFLFLIPYPFGGCYLTVHTLSDFLLVGSAPSKP